jgi:hypothetical protein
MKAQIHTPTTSMHSYKYYIQYFFVFSLLIPQILIGTFFLPYFNSTFTSSSESSSRLKLLSGLEYSANRKLSCRLLICYFKMCRSVIAINCSMNISLTEGAAHWNCLTERYTEKVDSVSWTKLRMSSMAMDLNLFSSRIKLLAGAGSKLKLII